MDGGRLLHYRAGRSPRHGVAR